MGFVAAIFNVVPFLGPIIAFAPAALLSLTLGFGQLVITTVIFLAINMLDGNVISPVVFSRTVKLHPITVLVAVLAGGSLLGLVGAVLAVPTAAFLRLLYQDYYLTSGWYQGQVVEGSAEGNRE